MPTATEQISPTHSLKNVMAEKPPSSETPKLQKSGKLSVDHLREAVDYGWSWRSRWKYIGLELGIDAGTLDSIKQSNHEKPDDYFQEVIQRWLQNARADPTWEQLDRALKAKTVAGENLITSRESRYIDGVGDTGTATGTRESDVKTVGIKKQKSPIHLLEGSTLKLVNKKGVKEVEWRQSGRERKEVYIECNYTNESNKGIPVFIQKEYEIPQLLKVDSKLQYGWQGDFYFFVLHDKDRRPFQHRFVSTITKEFFKQASSAIASVWGAHLETVNDV